MKIIRNVKSQKFPSRKMAQNGRECFPIAEISPCYRKSVSLNPTALSELQPWARKLAFLRMWRRNVAKINKKFKAWPNRQHFEFCYRKSTSLRMTVTTEFGTEIQVTAFMPHAHAQKEKVKMLSARRNFPLLLELGVAESNGVVRIAAKHSDIAFSAYAH